MEITFTKMPELPHPRPAGVVKDYVDAELSYDAQFFHNHSCVEARDTLAKFKEALDACARLVRHQLSAVLIHAHVRPGDILEIPPRNFTYRAESLTVSDIGSVDVRLVRVHREDWTKEVRMKGAYSAVSENRRMIAIKPEWVVQRVEDKAHKTRCSNYFTSEDGQ